MSDAKQPHLSNRPFPAYTGREPFVFTSYAHVDSPAVFAELLRFRADGFRVWYDEGIAPGSIWSDEIADAISRCACFVVFLTPRSADSLNVRNEIDFAISENRHVIAIYLEETALKGGLKLQMQVRQGILKYAMSDEEYRYTYRKAFTGAGIQPAQDSGDAWFSHASFDELPPIRGAQPQPPSGGDGVTLRFLNGCMAGREIDLPLNGDVTLGRAPDCDVCIPEPTVSTRHCVLHIDPPWVTIMDSESKNGTSVNDVLAGKRGEKKQVTPVPVPDGAVVRLSRDCSFSVRIRGEQTKTDGADAPTATDDAPTEPDEVTRPDDSAAAADDRLPNRVYAPPLFHHALCAGGSSQKGPVRGSNQDAIVSCPQEGFFAVIDGAGGVLGGGEAARLLHDELPHRARQMTAQLGAKDDAERASELLQSAVREMSDRMYREQNSEERTRYAAALACVWFVEQSAVIVHLGDCRAYLLPKDARALRRLTNDHNRAYEDVEAGLCTVEEARLNGLTSRLTRFVGMTPPVGPDVSVVPVAPGDQLLLCSDGLYSSVAESELVRMMREGVSAEAIPRRMTQTACDAGARDNATAQYVMVVARDL